MIEVLTNSKNRIMLKSILSLKGAEELTKKQQKEIKGSWIPPEGRFCPNGTCQYYEGGPCRKVSDQCI
ncbi:MULTISPECIES: hypothetical protein [Flavobacterium]|jgi:hypothetical protein|uniref:Uncharacterized protein n=1 Tax=Flavobacterium hydatis TaxID=991 RepID=A0A086AI36_FLAHY|nr:MULTISPECIES: hypothetical protein [Flavobacterium]KIC03748.1 hypothetical protein OA88_01205 [Flavobacterium sp. JRM]KFF16350.1 hypothetical protein IW20_11405 [Flavobacterium hydatis]KIA97919.1 hypothetical protein OA93_13200 [Flavobacterium sp. KMS]MEA9413914.1 hypothetical protein [Flavobacterium sp. PL02]OUL61611.1 hypothetical protein B8T70_14275 [Flavobacterium sp. AJR]